jgi:hypothetical protein
LFLNFCQVFTAIHFGFFAFGDQGGLFLKKPSPLHPPAKTFHQDGFLLFFFFVTLCVPLWLKTGGGFWGHGSLDFYGNLC